MQVDSLKDSVPKKIKQRVQALMFDIFKRVISEDVVE